MLIYNSQLKKLVLPEYGRNIHQMVSHCMTIADREERNRCAYTIVAIMDNMFPELHNEAGYKQKLVVQSAQEEIARQNAVKAQEG